MDVVSGLLQTFWPMILATIVPIIIAFLKTKVFPNVPTLLIPVIAPALALVVDNIMAWVASTPSTGLGAVLLGLAGVGIREIFDQARKTLVGA